MATITAKFKSHCLTYLSDGVQARYGGRKSTVTLFLQFIPARIENLASLDLIISVLIYDVEY